MGTINPSIPTIGQPNSTEDADIRDGMVTIRDEINGNLDNDNLKSAANISGSKLAANSVPTSKLVNGTAGQLLIANASGVITATTVAGDVTIDNAGTTTIGADKVTNTQLRDDASTDANRAVTTNHIRDVAITTGKIADDAVDADKLKDDATTDANRAVTTNHIRNTAITEGKIADDAVTSAKLKDDATTDANRAVTTNHVRDAAITKDKLSLYRAEDSAYASSVTIDNSWSTVANINGLPAGVHLISVSLIFVTGSSSTFSEVSMRYYNNSLGINEFITVIDPIVGTTADYQRIPIVASFWVSNTSTLNGTLDVKAVNTSGGSPANAVVSSWNYTVLGFKTA